MGKRQAKTGRPRRRRQPAARPDRARATLADALFTSTQQRLLRLLFGQEGRTFFTTELFNLARAGRGAVQRELARLAESGLIVTTRVGNQRHFQANRAAPVYNELRAIVLKTVGLVDPIREALTHAASPIRLAFIYGSIARQTDTASSDVDLMIVSERLSLEQAYALLEGAEQSLSRRINITLLTPEEFRRRKADKSPFLTKILSGENVVLLGEADDLLGTPQSGSDQTA